MTPAACPDESATAKPWLDHTKMADVQITARDGEFTESMIFGFFVHGVDLDRLRSLVGTVGERLRRSGGNPQQAEWWLDPACCGVHAGRHPHAERHGVPLSLPSDWFQPPVAEPKPAE